MNKAVAAVDDACCGNERGTQVTKLLAKDSSLQENRRKKGDEATNMLACI